MKNLKLITVAVMTSLIVLALVASAAASAAWGS
jgi:hypothetical protein